MRLPMDTEMEILEFNESHKESWDDFVGSRSEANICHFLCYKHFIEEAFGYKPVYWLFRKKGKAVGVFPSFEYRNLLGMKFWISQPFIEYGGVLSEGLLKEDWLVFKKKVEEKLKAENIWVLKMHGFDSGYGVFYKENLYEYGYLDLKNPEYMWKNFLNRKDRQDINRALKNELECVPETTEKSIKEIFYPIYLESMKKLGSPPFSLKYFLIKYRAFGEKMKLFIVKDKEGVALSALMGYEFGKKVFIEFSVCQRKYISKRPNDLMYWKFIEWASLKGHKYFDFGTIRYATQKRFKQKWGIEVRDYVNSYIFNPEKQRKCYYLESSGHGVQFLSKLWSLFMPKLLAKYLGPILHKQLVK